MSEKLIQRIPLLATILLFGTSANYYLNTVLQYGFGMGSISAYIYIAMALVGAFSYYYMFKVRDKKTTILFSILFLGTSIAYLFGGISRELLSPDYNPIESPLMILFLYCFPLFILIRRCQDFEKLYHYMYYGAIVVMILFIPGYYYSMNYLSAISVDYMSISYNVLLAVCVGLSYSWNYKQYLIALLSISVLALAVIVGARGVAISAAVFLLLLLYYRLGSEGKIRTILTVGTLFLVLIAFSPSLLSKVDSLIGSGDMYSRNLVLYESGDFFHSSGRDEIKDAIEDGIDSYPIGLGLFGDKIMMKQHNLPATYAHNILLEFRSDFGIIFGPIIFILLLVLVYKTLRSSNTICKELEIVLLPSGLVKLWFSGSFLVCAEFFALLAILLMIKDRLHEKNMQYL